MNQFIKGALVANAAAMGYNWIYNMPYLEKLSKEQSLVFQKADPAQYERAKKSYYVYPKAEIGDVSVQGEVLKWLYIAMKDNPELTVEDYEKLVFNQFQPGGDYQGYIESYGKKLVINRLSEILKLDIKKVAQTDDQLVGIVPYLVCKELNLSNEKAIELKNTFTNKTEYDDFFIMFDHIIEAVKNGSLKEALKKNIKYAPKDYYEKLEKAIEIDDTKKFIIDHAGTDCHIPKSIPLIYHILYHATDFEDAVVKNVLIGGASCDRGLVIGAIFSQVSEIPEAWIKKTKLNF
ncbi:ADP-ribosylglycohydrolase family protein [Peloplasma aerotolerans]|uniref:ADP-ribosylglycohydrolase family protein n=1 Tax=Peloplasma aerotolerans TaxID=3044389 RepID=A0AAW6U9E6_9MOLU|nr:ADP-ribosylglycohydrolase family protein [Mariniplasma sp. M4Ah]MDI6453320.1 ADP-ribosylglycohydrolase family protein [Mariniplasma sp. M4Ah]